MARPLLALLSVYFLAGWHLAAQGDRAGVLEAVRRQDYVKALELLTPLLSQEPDNPALWTLKGVSLSELGRVPESLAAYRKALQSKPDFLPALQKEAEIEFRTTDPRLRQTLGKLLSLEPTDPQGHVMLGVLEARKGDCASAARHFAQAGDQSSQNPLTLNAQASCLFSAQRLSEAADVYKRLVALRPEDAAARFNWALCLHESGRNQEAIGILKPSTAGPKPDADELSLLARAYEADHRLPDSIAALMHGVQLFPNEEQFYLDLGEICFIQDNPQMGIDVLSAGLKHRPASDRMLTMRGILYSLMARYESSDADFERARKIAPQDGIAQLGKATASYRQGKDEEAVRTLHSRLREHPDDPAANLALGKALLARGAAPGQPEFEEAQRALERSLRAEPRNTSTHIALAMLFVQSGESERAIEQFRLALQLEPANRTALFQLIRIFRKSSRNEEADRLLAQFRQLLADERIADERAMGAANRRARANLQSAGVASQP